MCGIGGWVGSGGRVEPDRLKAMGDSLAHRGPDGSGQWVSEDQDLGLVHRRLAIIDLSVAANQPMLDEATGSRIVFNGEIYNHRHLRKELEQEGVRFLTDHSDTEVLLRGYLQWGMDGLLSRCNGMFAFGLLDGRSKRLFIVRDRVGIKPLYICRLHGQLLFASEIKALLRSGVLKGELDLESFWHFLMFRSLPAPRSLFRNVEKLAPGSYLTVDSRTLEERNVQYWDPLENANASTAPASMREADDQLEHLLFDSVRLRMEADTDVGVFLSGGLDSTFVLQAASAEKSPIDTFTATYQGYPQYDEAKLAQKGAMAYGARFFDVPVSESRYLDALTSVAYYQDEPIAAPVCVPVYLLSERARAENVPVILAGEGADEIFIGYENWLRMRDAQRLVNGVPGVAARGAARLGAMSLAPFGRGERVRELLSRVARGEPVFWGGALDFTENGRRRIAGPAVDGHQTDTFAEVIVPHWQRFRSNRHPSDVAAWMTYLDVRFRLPELMLPRLDKMGMAFSIEGRVPFLDHRIIEFLLGLPPSWRGGSGRIPKPMFRRVAARSMDPEMISRRKRGFQAPVKEWKSGAFRTQYMSPLMAFAKRSGLFDVNEVEVLMAKTGDRLYFNLVNFMLWYCLFIENIVEDHLGDLTSRVRLLT